MNVQSRIAPRYTYTKQEFFPIISTVTTNPRKKDEIGRIHRLNNEIYHDIIKNTQFNNKCIVVCFINHETGATTCML